MKRKNKRKFVGELMVVVGYKRGLSMIGLARKYGLTVPQVEQIIRRALP